MAVSFVGAGATAEANNAAITPGLPTRQAGDLLVAVVGLRSNTATVTVSSGSGWMHRVSYASAWGSGANSIHVLTRTATGDSGDAVTLAPSGGSSGVDVIGCIFAVHDAHNADPVSAYSGAYGTSNQEDIGPTASLIVPDAGSLAVIVGSKANDSSATPGTEIATPTGWGYIFVEDTVGGDDLLIDAFCKITSSSNDLVDAGALDVLPTSGPASWAALTFAIAPPASGVEGQLTASLAPATVDATGRVAISASCEPDLSPASAFASAKVQTHGSLSQTLSAGLCVAHAALWVRGSSSGTLTASEALVVGRVAVSLHLNGVLSPASATGTGRVLVSGQLGATLQHATLEANTSGGSTGNLSTVLAAATMAAAGHVATSGQIAASLKPDAANGTGHIAVAGQLAGRLDPFQAHSTAKALLVGSCAVGLSAATTTATGRVSIAASLAVGLDPATLDARTSGNVTGQLTAALLPGDLQASGFSLVRGGVEEHLAAATGSGDGRFRLAAVAAVGLGAAHTNGHGQVLVAARAVVGLAATVGSGDGRVAVAAAASVGSTAGDVGASALVEIHGGLAASLASADLDGVGTVRHLPISGTFAAVPVAAQAAAIATVAVEGVLAVTLAGSHAHSAGRVALKCQGESHLAAATVEGIGIAAWILALVYGSVCGPQETGAASGAGGPGFVQGPGSR